MSVCVCVCVRACVCARLCSFIIVFGSVMIAIYLFSLDHPSVLIVFNHFFPIQHYHYRQSFLFAQIYFGHRKEDVEREREIERERETETETERQSKSL